VTLSGEQWLEQIFRPIVRSGPSPVLGGRLYAQVQALGATGVLTASQVADAINALAEIGYTPELRSVTATAFGTGSTAAVAVREGTVVQPVVEEPPVLRAVLGGPLRLGQFDGRPVTLVSVQLWSNRVVIDLFADPGPDYAARRAEAHRARLKQILSGRKDMPRPMVSPLQSLMWTLGDEHGTAYRVVGGSGHTDDHTDRRESQWSPAPPANTEHLTLRGTDPNGTVVLDIEVPVPAS
jgi:hypothetical protein